MTRARQNDVNTIVKAFDLIQSCCDTIEECGGCRECPLYGHCLKDDVAYDACTDVTSMRWQEFVGFADDVEDIMRERNMSDEERDRMMWEDYYDRQRKGERDEAYIDSIHGW